MELNKSTDSQLSSSILVESAESNLVKCNDLEPTDAISKLFDTIDRLDSALTLRIKENNEKGTFNSGIKLIIDLKTKCSEKIAFLGGGDFLYRSLSAQSPTTAVKGYDSNTRRGSSPSNNLSEPASLEYSQVSFLLVCLFDDVVKYDMRYLELIHDSTL